MSLIGEAAYPGRRGEVVDLAAWLGPEVRGEDEIGAQAVAELADAEHAMTEVDGGSDGEPLADRIRRWGGGAS